MSSNTLRTVDGTFIHRTGVEGPRHDPYSFEEYEYRDRSGWRTIAHRGIGERYEVIDPDGSAQRRVYASDDEDVDLFSGFFGMSIAELTRAFRKRDEANLRAHRSHGGFDTEPGYPGEWLLVCKCGAVVDSDFDESAVI